MRWRGELAALACVLMSVLPPAEASAADHPVAGRRLSLAASQRRPENRRLRLTVRDASIGPPFSDPTAGAALVVFASGAPGQCFAEIALDPAKWEPLRGDGAAHGYRYRAGAAGTQGVRRIVVAPGRLTVSARGPGFPCDLSASAQQMPVSIQFRTGGDRYCAAFGGMVTQNAPGRFRAHDAAAPSACPDQDLTVANLNILHGLSCPDPDHCRLPERIDLLFQWVVAAGCPDVVTLQEVVDRSPTFTALAFIDALAATACPFPYQRTYFRTTIGIDDEMILSRYPVISAESRVLHLGFRHVTFARIDHPIGPVDVFSTHLASGSDGGPLPCSGCPPECIAAGAVTNRDCQAVQMAEFIAARHDVAGPAVATGDFNASPGGFVYNQFVGRGWTDTHLAVGNPECDPFTGVGCTSGRVDDDLTELESPLSNEDERIDYVFLVPPGVGSVCAATLDSSADADGDGTATRIFADDPNPFSPTCGPAPDPICWPSDHEGAQADLNCE